ncbi:MAG TPA: histidine phosphatase family protein [Acidimicrobiales bacterium]|nr:histidine phosphatase family protein [Acidimicrobiales bacterium]
MVSLPTPTTRLLLVRHGQSEWNATGLWQGQADPPLTELGRRQAAEAARAIGTVDAVWASDLVRAVETATIIADSVGVGPVVVDPDLRERDAGEFSGLTREQIDQRYPGYLADGRRPPGWEPDDSLLDRAVAALRRVAAAVPSGDVVVVTHGGVVYAVEQHLGHGFQRLANGEGRWVEVDASGVLVLGERVVLAAPEDTTVPDQL